MRILDSLPIMGLWNMGDTPFHSPIPSKEAKNIIKKAYRMGIRTFDTAFSYGNADTLLYSAMRELGKDDWSVISKVMPVPTLRKKAEISLSRLHKDCFSVLLLHWPTEDESLYRSLKELESLLSEGKAEAIGISNFPLTLLKKVMHDFPLTYHERPLSLIWDKDYEEEKNTGIKILAYAPLGMGLLSGKYSRKEDIADSRASLYAFSSPHMEELLTLLANKPSMALSWVYMKKPYGVVSGYGKVEELEILRNIKTIDNENFSHLSELSHKITSLASSDNIFAHNWK